MVSDWHTKRLPEKYDYIHGVSSLVGDPKCQPSPSVLEHVRPRLPGRHFCLMLIPRNASSPDTRRTIPCAPPHQRADGAPPHHLRQGRREATNTPL
jgi:hypothetical protein